MSTPAGPRGRHAFAPWAVRVALVASCAPVALGVAGPAAPVAAQRPTAVGPATPSVEAPLRPLADCVVAVEAVTVEPRILDADAQAVVEVVARYALAPDATPDRIAVVLGPIDADLAATVTSALDAFAGTLGLERGVELAVVQVAAAPTPVAWHSGAVGLERARATIAATGPGDVAFDTWHAALTRAVDALTASPPALSTALLVVADRPPRDAAAAPDWRPLAQRLDDALVRRALVSLSPSGWLATLGGRFGTVFAIPATSRSEAPIVLREALRTVVGLPSAGWIYEHDLGVERWRAFELPPTLPGRVAISDAEVVWTDTIDRWTGTFTLRYGVKLASKSGLGAAVQMALADGTHALVVAIDTARRCRMDFDPIMLCVHRSGRADACAAVAATWTAAAPPATATPRATPVAPPGPTATPSPAAATAVPSPASTTTPPGGGMTGTPSVATATLRPASTGRPPTATAPGDSARRLWLPWTVARPEPASVDAGRAGAAPRPWVSRRRPGTPR